MSDVLPDTRVEGPAAGVDAAMFRAALAQWPTGVTVVTTLSGGQWHGLTASSFSSVSLEPPLVLICVARKAYAHDLIVGSGCYGVTILGKDQADVGKRFARFDPGAPDRFAGSEWVTAVSGAPVLASALGWVDCHVKAAMDGGDHTIFIGEVLAAGTPRVTSPLLYHSRNWGQFADLLPETVVVAELSGEGAIADVETDVEGMAGALEMTVASTDVHARPRVVIRGAFRADPEAVAGAVARLSTVVPAGIVLADCEGSASPVAVREVCREVVLRAGSTPVWVRLSDAEGFGYANLLVALKSGVQRVDVGGCAMAKADVRRLVERLGLEMVETDD